MESTKRLPTAPRSERRRRLREHRWRGLVRCVDIDRPRHGLHELEDEGGPSVRSVISPGAVAWADLADPRVEVDKAAGRRFSRSRVTFMTGGAVGDVPAAVERDDVAGGSPFRP